jgi:hypothetical protein
MQKRKLKMLKYKLLLIKLFLMIAKHVKAN